MSDAYSLLLLLAIAAVVAAGAASLLGRRPPPAGRLGRWTVPLALGALLLDLAALCVHLATGHRPGSPEPMGVREFLAGHPALAVVAVFAVAALALRQRRR